MIKYPPGILHLCAKCPLNLKIYIFFLIKNHTFSSSSSILYLLSSKFYSQGKTKNQTLKRYQVVEINQDKNAIAAENWYLSHKLCRTMWSTSFMQKICDAIYLTCCINRYGISCIIKIISLIKFQIHKPKLCFFLLLQILTCEFSLWTHNYQRHVYFMTAYSNIITNLCKKSLLYIIYLKHMRVTSLP